MAFISDKCTKLTISHKKKPYIHDPLHSHILEDVTSAKYLGVISQSNLKGNLHYDNVHYFKKQ